MGTLFGESEEARRGSGQNSAAGLYVQAYVAVGRTLDDLPYTPQWEELMSRVREHAAVRDVSTTEVNDRSVFHALQTIRKRGDLPRVGRGGAAPVRVTAEDEALIEELLVARAGTIGQRDQLPFTPQFDELAQAFNERSGRALSPYEVWRLVAKVSK
jgi:hypothetical protein